MMIRTVVLLSIPFFMISCDALNPTIGGEDGLKVVRPRLGGRVEIKVIFGIADTTGQPTAIYHAGESIDMTFVLVNLTGVDQLYHYTGPTVIFEVNRGDSTFASSVDGLAWPQVVLTGILKKGQKLSQSWRGPNSPVRNPRIALPSGNYSARAVIRYYFDNTSVAPPADIPFTVLR